MARRSRSELKKITAQFSGGLVDLRISHDIVDFERVLRRTDLRPVWDRIKNLKWFEDPEFYTRPDRYRGGRGMPDKDGERRNWGPGYDPYNRVGRTKRKITVRSRRPFHPRPTEANIERLIEATLAYMIDGRLP